MDFASVILVSALLVGLFVVLGGERAHSATDTFLNALAGIENAVRSFYAYLASIAKDPSTHWTLRLVLAAFVRVSWYVWLCLALAFVLMAFYGKALRSVIRYTGF